MVFKDLKEVLNEFLSDPGPETWNKLPISEFNFADPSFTYRVEEIVTEHRNLETLQSAFNYLSMVFRYFRVATQEDLATKERIKKLMEIVNHRAKSLTTTPTETGESRSYQFASFSSV